MDKKPEKQFRVVQLAGHTQASDSIITGETALREYALGLVSGPQSDAWIEKIQKDPIEQVVEYLNMAGINVSAV